MHVAHKHAPRGLTQGVTQGRAAVFRLPMHENDNLKRVAWGPVKRDVLCLIVRNQTYA